MSAPTRGDETGLSPRDELAVHGAALTEAPWGAAAVTGAVVAGADLMLHVAGLDLSLATPLSAVSAGTVAFFAVAGGGALWRGTGRAMRWARRYPWRFAVLPGIATAIVVFVLSVIIGGGSLISGSFTALWHGGIAYGLTGMAGVMRGTRRRST